MRKFFTRACVWVRGMQISNKLQIFECWATHMMCVESGRPSLLMVFYFELITPHTTLFSPTERKNRSKIHLPFWGLSSFFPLFLSSSYAFVLAARSEQFILNASCLCVCRLLWTISPIVKAKKHRKHLSRESTYDFFGNQFPCLLFTKKFKTTRLASNHICMDKSASHLVRISVTRNILDFFYLFRHSSAHLCWHYLIE